MYRDPQRGWSASVVKVWTSLYIYLSRYVWAWHLCLFRQKGVHRPERQRPERSHSQNPPLTSVHYHPLEECQNSIRPWHGVQSRMSTPPSAVGQFSPTQALNLRGTSAGNSLRKKSRSTTPAPLKSYWPHPVSKFLLEKVMSHVILSKTNCSSHWTHSLTVHMPVFGTLKHWKPDSYI